MLFSIVIKKCFVFGLFRPPPLRVQRGTLHIAKDVGIVIEGIKVMDNLGRVIMGFIMLFGIINALDRSFPDNLKYTFEFIQK